MLGWDLQQATQEGAEMTQSEDSSVCCVCCSFRRGIGPPFVTPWYLVGTLSLASPVSGLLPFHCVAQPSGLNPVGGPADRRAMAGEGEMEEIEMRQRAERARW